MTRLNFQDFSALPAGTLFYHFTDGECFFAELFKKGDTLFVDGQPVDFFETALFPSLEDVRAAVSLNPSMGRWALYEFDTAEFIVLDADDIATLVSELTQPS